MKIDSLERSRWKHPRTAQFLQHLASIQFADRYDALCRAHAQIAVAPSAPVQRAAMRKMGRPICYSNRWGRYQWREAWRVPSRLPKYSAIGLDIRITERVELELLFATPDGHLSGPFPRFLQQLRRLEKPDYKHVNPAPRIGAAAELPIIVAESLALYDDIARSLKGDSWWELTPRPRLQEAPAEPPYELAA